MIELFNKYDTFKSKDSTNRLRIYVSYLNERGLAWYQPDLDAYRTYLKDEKQYAARSIKAHLTSIRNWYRDLLETIRETENMSLDAFLMDQGIDLNQVEARSVHLAMRAAAEYDPATKAPDVVRDWYPSKTYLEGLFDFSLQTPQDLRDLLVLGLLFSAGLTPMEVVALEPKHVRHSKPMQLTVPAVQSIEEREITTADNILFDDAWLQEAYFAWINTMNIEEGQLVASFYRAGIRQRDTPLTVRGIEKLVKQHAVRAVGDKTNEPLITPMDLRRSAARRLYLSEQADVETIAKLLGLSRGTAMSYIGLIKPATYPSKPLSSSKIRDRLTSFSNQR